MLKPAYNFFLSRLYGVEVDPKVGDIGMCFLSRLYGVEVGR